MAKASEKTKTKTTKGGIHKSKANQIEWDCNSYAEMFSALTGLKVQLKS